MTIIRLEMNDWLYNAGLVGLYSILKHSGDIVEPKVQQQYIEFNLSVLDGFEEKYFKYFIDKYEKYLSWHKIVSYGDVINYYEDNNFEHFGEKDLESLNKYIKDVIKKYLKSASYKSAYDLIDSKHNILDYVSEINAVKLKKKENIEDKIFEIKDIFSKLKIIIAYCNKLENKRYLAGKNVIYTMIKNSWNGICFLNPQTKEKDIYLDYKSYFVDTIRSYMEDNREKYKYKCFICDREISDLKNDLSFMNNIGFDVSRKSSHVWNFNNDVAVCPICKLVYSCIPAGITYVYNKGIFINDNHSFDRLVNINSKIRDEILKEQDMNQTLTYKALVNSIQEQVNNKLKYELSDIQIVRYEDEKYRFNILSRKMLKTINKVKDDLNKIINSGYREINTYFNIYPLVMDRILNNQNMFTLIHKLLAYKLSKPKECRFGISHIMRIININSKSLEGLGYMGKIDEKVIKNGNRAGYYLRERYSDKGAKDKLNGISYRLLNALKTNNKNMFMDTLLNCYLYAQKTVPAIFMEALKDEEKFKTIGYAFVAGLIEGKDNKKAGENNDEK
ncbi:type I-B CRISPR-associated protein Cas8b1/Cst1 [Wukongibacter sp. M2B1]|uniref:type I-B CRISPR-associated protein Cas8b1/Cst1 n=1 Tax=Wukongibacter sp. M2B1 TaxID=3088895 RepID=UPI003D7B7CAC